MLSDYFKSGQFIIKYILLWLEEGVGGIIIITQSPLQAFNYKNKYLCKYTYVYA